MTMTSSAPLYRRPVTGGAEVDTGADEVVLTGYFQRR